MNSETPLLCLEAMERTKLTPGRLRLSGLAMMMALMTMAM